MEMPTARSVQGPVIVRSTPVRVAVVYRHPLLRDIAVQLLREAGVDVVAVSFVDARQPAEPGAMRADVVVVERDGSSTLDHVTTATVLSEDPESASTVVTIGLDSQKIVVCHRRTVERATVAALVNAVVGPRPSGDQTCPNRCAIPKELVEEDNP
jgi:hypothetical protein